MHYNLENNFAFIDSQNLYKGLQELGWHLDFKRFRQYLEDKYQVRKAFYFIGYVATNIDLYTQLQNAGFRCSCRILGLAEKLKIILNYGGNEGNEDKKIKLQFLQELQGKR